MRHEADIGGRLISYLDVAPPASHRAGVLLLLHAFPLAAEMWAPQLSAVPSGWRFVAPDFRGFGRSAPDDSRDDGRAIDDYARDVLALLDHLQVAAPVVCGLSMGGYAAFALRRLAPARIRGLVLADTRPDADSDAARTARRQALATLRDSGPEAVVDAMLPRLLGPTTRSSRPAVVDRVRALARSQSAEGIGAAIVRLMTRPDSTATLAAFDGPTLVIAGEEDEITGPEVARAMHGQLARADLALVRHAGHLSNLEQPDVFNEALDRFLATRFVHS
jgi:3-oxoadipate enol-lactonase